MAKRTRQRNRSAGLLEAVKGSKITVEGSGELEIDGDYAIPEKLTLGEAMELERIVAGGGGAHILTGLTYIAVRREHDDVSLQELMALDSETVELVEPQKEEAADPPPKATTRKRSAAQS